MSTVKISSHAHTQSFSLSHPHRLPLGALLKASFIYWLLNFSLAISFNSHTKAKIQSQRQRWEKMAKATTDGATITTSNNNNNKQQQQQRAAVTKYNVFVLKATTAKTLLLVCLCACVHVSMCVCLCVPAHHRYNQSAIVCVDERSNGAGRHVCPPPTTISSFPQSPLTRLPSCRCAFLRQKTAARNHNDKNHASRHRPIRTHHTHTHRQT